MSRPLVASHPQGSIPESVQSGAPIPADLNEFNRQTIITISNNFDAKRRKYNESYSGLPHVSDLLIVCEKIDVTPLVTKADSLAVIIRLDRNMGKSQGIYAQQHSCPDRADRGRSIDGLLLTAMTGQGADDELPGP